MSDHTPSSILMVINHMDWFWSHRLPLAQAILDGGMALTLAAPNVLQDVKLKDFPIQTLELYAPGSRFSVLKELKLILSLYRSIKQDRSDIVHAITLRFAFYTGLCTKILGKKRCVFTIAGLGSLFTADSLNAKILRLFLLPFFRFAFRGRGRFIIFQNPDDAQAFKNLGLAEEGQSTVIKGSGVDLNHFKQVPLPHNDKPMILLTSRLIREKGIADFVRAAQIVKATHPQAHFVIAGRTDDTNPKYHSTADLQNWQEEGAIEWRGHVNDMPGLIAQSTMFVLPSFYREGVPKSILEALAIGRPVITTNAPGCRETVEDGLNGYLIPPHEPEQIAAKVIDLINDPDRCRSMGENSRQKAQAEFSTQFVIEQTIRVYHYS